MVVTNSKVDHRGTGVLLLLSLIVPVFFFLDIMVGSYYISLPEIFNGIFQPESTDSQIVLIINQFRIPKALTAILAGAALSVAGLQMQTVFRNPLAGRCGNGSPE